MNNLENQSINCDLNTEMNKKLNVEGSYKIKHGLIKGFDGTSEAISKDNEFYSICAFYGPYESTNNNFIDQSSFDVNLKVSTTQLPKSDIYSIENRYISIIEKILLHFYDITETNKSLFLTVQTNSIDLEMIINSISVAAADGGIPLKSLFYSKSDEKKVKIYNFDEKEIFSFFNLSNKYGNHDSKKLIGDSLGDLFIFE